MSAKPAVSRLRRGRVVALGLFWAVLGACADAGSGQLSGRWVGVGMESLDGSVSAARTGWAKGTSLTFSGSRLSVALPGEPPREGRYEVISENDGQLELAVAGHDGHVDRTELTIETHRLLRWHLTRVHTLVMQRQ